jgi:hypothetical protein
MLITSNRLHGRTVSILQTPIIFSLCEQNRQKFKSIQNVFHKATIIKRKRKCFALPDSYASTNELRMYVLRPQSEATSLEELLPFRPLTGPSQLPDSDSVLLEAVSAK